jgi:hypothetical protein
VSHDTSEIHPAHPPQEVSGAVSAAAEHEIQGDALDLGAAQIRQLPVLRDPVVVGVAPQQELVEDGVRRGDTPIPVTAVFRCVEDRQGIETIVWLKK